jgi:uncharacterized damage-inducible protein DinB
LTIDDIQLLYEYDRWANNRVLQAIAELTTEEFTRNLGGSFSSVRDTFLHIVSGEWVWLQYWNAPLADSAFLQDIRHRRSVLFAPEAYPSVAEARSRWTEVEQEQVQFLKALSEEGINKMLPFRTTRVPLARLMQHLANHSTYHRGQISLMLRQLGAKPIATDFHEFVVDEQRAAALKQ